MAVDDLYEVRLCYQLADVTMYLRMQYKEIIASITAIPAETIAREWDETILPRVQFMWGETCHALYIYARRVAPDPGVPFLRETSASGLSSGACVAPASSLVITAYAFGPGRLPRASYRIGGIAEGLQNDGVLTSAGETLSEELATTMFQDLVVGGGGSTRWVPGIIAQDATFHDYVSVQARAALGVQRPRKVRPGIRP